MTRTVRVSKMLTRILRHKAVLLGLNIGSDGYCRLDQVLAVCSMRALGVTTDEVKEVVGNSEKKRFTLKYENGVT